MQSRSIRVGSFTLGATLLGVGAALLAHNLGKVPEGLELWRFWPLLPLLLGLEYLVRQQLLQPKGEQAQALRLDGAALFLSIFALFAGITYSAIPTSLADARSLVGLVRPFEYQTQVRAELSDLTGVERLVISNRSGDVRIEGTDASTISVLAHVHAWETTPEAAESLAREFKVAITKGTEARLEVEQPAAGASGPRRWSVSYEVQVPKSLLTSADVTFGALTVKDITAGELAARNGALTASDLRGNVRIVNSFGRVDLQRLTGSLEIDGRNTTIRISDISGSAQVVNEFGPVEISEAGGALQVKNTQGNITVHNWQAAAGDWDLETRFGSIDVSLPHDSSIAFTGQTRFGNVEVPDWASVSRDVNQQMASGTLGAGERKVLLRTSNGSLRLSTGGTQVPGSSSASAVPPAPPAPAVPPATPNPR